MKIINKKIKNTLISSLTLLASGMSVVACNPKKKDNDQNYTDFTNSLKSVVSNDDFLTINSSLQWATNSGPVMQRTGLFENTKYKTDIDNFNPDNITFYNWGKTSATKDGGVTVNPNTLSDFKDKIQNDGSDITIGENSLKDLVFSYNFDITFTTSDNPQPKDKNSVTIKDVTVFFLLKTESGTKATSSLWTGNVSCENLFIKDPVDKDYPHYFSSSVLLDNSKDLIADPKKPRFGFDNNILCFGGVSSLDASWYNIENNKGLYGDPTSLLSLGPDSSIMVYKNDNGTLHWVEPVSKNNLKVLTNFTGRGIDNKTEKDVRAYIYCFLDVTKVSQKTKIYVNSIDQISYVWFTTLTK